MQLAFINNLQKLQKEGAKRALLISATGTGKTYASAFALRENNPRKVLFLVHREQIAKQAINSYKKVFGRTKTFGIFSGNSKEYEADYLFSTIQMMAKQETLECFKRNEFDTIIIDEYGIIGQVRRRPILKASSPSPIFLTYWRLRCKDGAEFTIEYLHYEGGGVPGPERTKNVFMRVG